MKPRDPWDALTPAERAEINEKRVRKLTAVLVTLSLILRRLTMKTKIPHDFKVTD